jgi:hypothetical protein
MPNDKRLATPQTLQSGLATVLGYAYTGSPITPTGFVLSPGGFLLPRRNVPVLLQTLQIRR